MLTNTQLIKLFLFVSCLSLFVLFSFSAHADPEYIWQKHLTESSRYHIEDITTDPDGNVITTGSFRGEVDFGGTTLSTWESSIAIAKYNSSGDLLWVRNAGGAFLEVLGASKSGQAVTTDSTGTIYITGYIIGRSAAHDVDFDGTTLRVSGTVDMFVAKYSSAGVLQWVRRAGMPLDGPHVFGTRAFGHDIAVNSAGEVVVIGSYSNEIEFDSYTITTERLRARAFLVKYDADGSVIWVKQHGGIDRFYGYATTIDRTGHIYATGLFVGEIEVAGRTLSAASGETHAYLAKYRSNGTLVWLKHFPTTDYIAIDEITTNESGDIIIVGNFSGEVTLGTTRLNSRSFPDLHRADVYVAKLNSAGNVLWAKHGGGYSYDHSTGLAVDRDGHIFLSGYINGVAMTSADFEGLPLSVADGVKEVFLAMYRSDGFLLEVDTLNIRHGYSLSSPDAKIALAHPTNDTLFIATDYTSMISMTGETISASLTNNVIAKFRVRPGLPTADACETDSDDIASPCELGAWTHLDWLCTYDIRRHFGDPGIRCPGIFENGVAPRSAEDVWFIERPNLALETTTASDFYSINIPNPALVHRDIRSREMIIAHPDEPDPLFECGTVQRRGVEFVGRDNNIYVSVSGMLNISVEPQSNGTSRRPISTNNEEIHIYNGTTRADSIATGPPLSKTILCPRSDPAEVSIGKGLTSVGFSMGERSSPREEIATGGYRLNVDYVIKAVRGLPSWVISWMDERNTRFVMPLPCAGGGIGGLPGRPDFPNCGGELGNPPVMTLPHPIDPKFNCLADGPGCWDLLTFDWQFEGMPFEMNFSLPEGMAISLIDINQKEIASTMNQQGKNIAFNIDKLAKGRYFLAVSGQAGEYTMSFSIPDTNQTKVNQPAMQNSQIYLVLLGLIILVVALIIFSNLRQRSS